MTITRVSPGVVKVERQAMSLSERAYLPQVVAGMFRTIKHLVKNIVDRHEGRMIFSSVYGEGSTFGFQLPASETPVTLVEGDTETAPYGMSVSMDTDQRDNAEGGQDHHPENDGGTSGFPQTTIRDSHSARHRRLPRGRAAAAGYDL